MKVENSTMVVGQDGTCSPMSRHTPVAGRGPHQQRPHPPGPHPPGPHARRGRTGPPGPHRRARKHPQRFQPAGSMPIVGGPTSTGPGVTAGSARPRRPTPRTATGKGTATGSRRRPPRRRHPVRPETSRRWSPRPVRGPWAGARGRCRCSRRVASAPTSRSADRSPRRRRSPSRAAPPRPPARPARLADRTSVARSSAWRRIRSTSSSITRDVSSL